jgi:hypothetical protein
MSDALTIPAHFPWGEENSRRGVANQQIATDFLGAFPLGTTFSTAQFDAWAYAAGAVASLPGKGTPEWAHLCRGRREVMERIRRGGSHSRVGTPFDIESIGVDTWKVVAAYEAAKDSYEKIAKAVHGLHGNNIRKVKKLLQSTDWTQLPPQIHYACKSLYNRLLNDKEDAQTGAERREKDVALMDEMIAQSRQKALPAPGENTFE